MMRWWDVGETQSVITLSITKLNSFLMCFIPLHSQQFGHISNVPFNNVLILFICVCV